MELCLDRGLNFYRTHNGEAREEVGWAAEFCYVLKNNIS